MGPKNKDNTGAKFEEKIGSLYQDQREEEEEKEKEDELAQE